MRAIPQSREASSDYLICVIMGVYPYVNFMVLIHLCNAGILIGKIPVRITNLCTVLGLAMRSGNIWHVGVFTQPISSHQ